MSSEYTNQVLKVVVAQICQTIGWHSIQTTPLELMVDILHKYLEEISKQTYKYAELYNRTEANLDDIGLAYKDMNINLSDIAEYIQYVDPVPCAVDVPKYPLPKESHLNFLKPGSKEVVTRPVHMHEYLPPVNPPSEDDEPNIEKIEKMDGTVDVVNIGGDENSTSYFKRPGSVIDKPDVKKQRVMFEDDSRPIREISSVIMTTSGFISPAREGKLPDTKAPVIQQDVKPVIVHPPVSTTPAMPINSLDGSKFSDKKIKKNKPIHEKEKKRDKIPKDFLKPKKLEKFNNSGHSSSLYNMHQTPNNNHHNTNNSINSSVNNIKLEPPSIPSFPTTSITPIPTSNHNILSEKPHNVINATPPKKLGRPRKDRSGEPPNGNKKPPKTSKYLNPLANTDIFAPFMNPRSDFSSLPKARIEPPFLFGSFPPLNQSRFLLPSSMNSQIANFPLSQHPPPTIDEKIASEPDKQKLNIFKKISKVKDEFSLGKLETIKTEPKFNYNNNDQVIVIDDDQNSNHLPPTPSTPTISSFNKDLESFTNLFKKDNNIPLNMSMPKPSNVNHLPNPDFPFFDINRTSTPTKSATDGPKIRKKYKTKEKPNKKMDVFSNSGMMKNNDLFSSINTNKLLEQMASKQFQQHAANAVNQQNMLFPLFNFPSGPGLIPAPGLFPPFNLQRGPFGVPQPGGQNFGMRGPVPDINNLFMPRFKKTVDTSEDVKPVHIDKGQCNVAPLVPESLKLDITPPSFNHLSSSIPRPSIVPPEMFPKLHNSNTSYKNINNIIKMEEPNEFFGNYSQSITSLPMHNSTIPPPTFEKLENKYKGIDKYKEIIEIDDNDNDIIDLENTFKDKKEDKKHRKEKKEKEEKEGKLKKKKDKKEKLKNKEKSDRKKERENKKETKEKLKREKKEKKKEKERALASSSIPTFNDMESISSNDNLDQSSSVPKLTLKISGNDSPRPDTPDVVKKISTKLNKKEDLMDEVLCLSPVATTRVEREPSPELARISPLVTRPPKQPKAPNMKKKIEEGEKGPSTTEPNSQSQTLPPPNPTPTPGRGRPRGSTKLLNSPATKNLLNPNKIAKGSIGNITKMPKPTPPPPSSGPGVGSEVVGGEENLPTACGSVPTPIPAPSLPPGIRDSDGNQVWICPACGSIDDGTPMIGCDGCDAWYHWVCVGIQVPPDANEDWYCRVCIVKKQESHGSEKKKKRKKKDKKEH